MTPYLHNITTLYMSNFIHYIILQIESFTENTIFTQHTDAGNNTERETWLVDAHMEGVVGWFIYSMRPGLFK